MTDTKTSKNTAVADPPPEPEAISKRLPQRVVSAVSRIGRRIRRPRFSLPNRKELLFTALGLVLALVAGYVVIGGVFSGEAEEEPVSPMPDRSLEDQEMRKSLAPEELLQLAQGAVKENELDRATSFLEEGLANIDPSRHELRARFFSLLGVVSERRGSPLRRMVFQENSDRLLARSGNALVLYEQAVEAHLAGHHAEARSLVCQFLLRQGELTAEEREQNAPRALRLMGSAFHDEWARRAVGPVKVIAEPPFDFEADL